MLEGAAEITHFNSYLQTRKVSIPEQKLSRYTQLVRHRVKIRELETSRYK